VLPSELRVAVKEPVAESQQEALRPDREKAALNVVASSDDRDADDARVTAVIGTGVEIAEHRKLWPLARIHA